MQDQDIISEDERHEAASEEPAAVQQHMPTHLPSGFDGVEPGAGRAVSMKPPHKGKLFKSKHISSCHGTYIYDFVCINDAHLRAELHFDNGGLEQHGSVYVGDSPRAFCFVTFNTSGAMKCDYAMRGLLAGIAKRLVYHHKNLIKRKAKWAAAKAAKEGGAK